MLKKARIQIFDWLKWGEKYLKTDLIYFAKGGFWLGSGFGISMVGTFLLSLAFANLLPKESYGAYKYILSVTGIAGAFYLSGLGTIVAQSVSRGFEGTFMSAVKTSFKWSFIPTTISLSISVYYFFRGNNELGVAMLFPALLSPVSSSLGLYGAFLTGKKEFKNSTFYGTTSNLITNSVMILVLFTTHNPVYIVASYFISTTLLSIFFYFFVTNKYKPNDNVEKGAIVYGKHLSLMNVLGILSNNIDKILVFHFLGSGPLAVYSVASAPIDQINSLFKQSTPLFTPKIASQNKEEIKKNLPQKAMSLTLLMIIPAIIYILLIPYFYKIFFPKYLESIIYSQFLALTLLTYPKKPLGIAIVAHGSKKINYILSFLNPILLLTLKIIFLPIWGLAGAVAVEIINGFASILINLYFVKKI